MGRQEWAAGRYRPGYGSIPLLFLGIMDHDHSLGEVLIVSGALGGAAEVHVRRVPQEVTDPRRVDVGVLLHLRQRKQTCNTCACPDTEGIGPVVTVSSQHSVKASVQTIKV